MLISYNPSFVVEKVWFKKLDPSELKERDAAVNQTISSADRKFHHTLGCFEDTSTWIRSSSYGRH